MKVMDDWREKWYYSGSHILKEQRLIKFHMLCLILVHNERKNWDRDRFNSNNDAASQIYSENIYNRILFLNSNRPIPPIS